MGGIKNMFSSSTPDLPDPEPVPTETEPEAEAARDTERRKLKARRSMSGTLLTNPLSSTGNSGGLLGRQG